MYILNKRIILLALMLFCTIILSGCWNRRELDELGIVGAIATDMVDEKFLLTFELMRPIKSGRGGEGEEEGGVYVSALGDSVFEAIRNVTMKFDRRLFLPHSRVFIFSEEIARKGLIDYLDFWNRDHESRKSAYIIVTKGDRAESVLGVSGGLEKQTAIYLEDIIENQGANSKTVKVTVREFMMAYYSEGMEPVSIGVVEKKRKEQRGEAKEKYELNAEGSAVFVEGKLIGFLTGNETMGMNFVKNKVQSGIIVAPSQEGKGYTSVELLEVKSKNTLEYDGNKLSVKIKTSVTGMVSEETRSISLRDPAIIELLEKDAEIVVKQIIQGAIDKAQKELKSDIFGLGRIFMNKHYELWNQVKGTEWNKMFSRADIKVEARVELKRRGLINNPVLRKEVE